MESAESGDTESSTAGNAAAGGAAGARAPSVPGSTGGSTALPSVAELHKLGIQPKLTVGQQNDAYEQQADAVASVVTTGGSGPSFSDVSNDTGASVSTSATTGLEPVQTSASGTAVDTPPIFDSVASTIRNPGAGKPVPGRVRDRVEPVLGTSLDGVSVHSGPKAARAAGNLGARAFTRGSSIFLGNGESAHDTELLAHEATHVVQQNGTPDSDASQSTPSADVQRFVPDIALEELNDIADNIPGWTLFTVIIGYNPLLNEAVERTPANLVEGLLRLVPFGGYIVDKLREMEIFQDAFAWIENELGRANLTLARLKQTIEAAWEEASIARGVEYNINVARRHFGALYDDAVGFAESLVTGIMRLVRDAIVGLLETALGNNDAYELLTKILGRDPLRDEPVEAEPAEILADFLLLIGKEQHLQKLREENKLEDAANWTATQFSRFTDLLGQLGSLFTQALDALRPENLINLADNIRSLVTNVGTFLQRVWNFASDVASKVLEMVKEAVLGALERYATNELPGFHLLTVILGRNPFTGEPVPRTPVSIMRGFITLLPGGQAVYQRLSEAGVIEQAGARIQEAMTQLGITWEFVIGLFRSIWDTISIDALMEPIATFSRIVAQLRDPVSRLFAFIRVVLRETFHVLLAAMEFPANLIGSIINNVMQAFGAIRENPIGFLLNMLGAVKLGFQNFFANIFTHLSGGLVDWLFRGLQNAGISPPSDFSFQSVLDFVLEVLGLTTDMLWEKLGQQIGEENVERIRGAIDRLTGIWTFVKDVQERGLVAIWEYIQNQITGLWDMVLAKAREWIMERVINRGTQWLLSLLDPTGIMAVINGFSAFMSAVQSAAEYAADILGIVNDYVSTLAAVAQGELAAGAQKLEQGLANAIPVAIGFLANQFGLGNIGQKIKEIVGSIRARINQAMDWLIERAVSTVHSMLNMIRGSGIAEESAAPVDDDPEKAARIQAGLAAIEEREQRYLTADRISREEAEQVASSVHQDFPVFTRLEVVEGRGTWDYAYEASPENKKPGRRQEEGASALPYEIGDKVFIEFQGDEVIGELEQMTTMNGQEIVMFRIETGPQIGAARGVPRADVVNKVSVRDYQGHDSRYVLGNKLKKNWQGKKLRKTFFGGFRKPVLNWRDERLEELENPNNPNEFRDEITGKYVSKERVSIDHITPVSEYWNEGYQTGGLRPGKNATQKERADFYNTIGNLQLTTEEENTKKGGVPYDIDVGPDFRGPRE